MSAVSRQAADWLMSHLGLDSPRAPSGLHVVRARVLSAKISPRVWAAFERAVRRARTVFGDSARASELLRFLVAVRQSVRRVLCGESPQLASVPATLTAERVLSFIRREFVDQLRAEESPDAQHALNLLSALGHVQGLLDRVAPPSSAEQPRSDYKLAAMVEVAHDMRSPLSAMLFLIDLIRTGRSGAVSSLQERQLATVYGAALGLNQLASDLVDFVRGADRLVDQHPIPFSVSEVLRSVRDVVQPMAEEKGLTLQLISSEGDQRLGFPTALNRVLLNLTTNAVKYTKAGSVVVAARHLSCTLIEFSVRDSGPGIPPHVMPELFQPFRATRRAEEASFSSAGLGLSICHKLVRTLGSELRAITSAEQGTSFLFELDLPLVGRAYPET
jgi:signal transduction histidine kinase